jgi:ribonuclease HI
LKLPNAQTFPDENVWTIRKVEKARELYFDRSKCKIDSSVGVIIIPPSRKPIPLSYQLKFIYTNNMVEYELLIVGLRELLALGFQKIKISGDS